MARELTLEEVTALLLERFEEKGGDRLPPTAYNKLLHFVEKRLSERDVEYDLPLFWYMFGRVAVTSSSGVSTETVGDERGITCGISVSEISAPKVAVREAERGIEEGIDLYFDRGLDGLIRASYEDAPYEAQRVFLDLKEQLESEADQTQSTLSDFNVGDDDRVRDLLYEFIQEFPADSFPEYEQDLHKWYRLLSSELDDEDCDYEYALKLTKQFWRLFCLELALRENTGVSAAAITDELPGIHDSIEDEKQKIREWFAQEERELTRENARTNETALRAAEAVVAPQLGVEIDI